MPAGGPSHHEPFLPLCPLPLLPLPLPPFAGYGMREIVSYCAHSTASYFMCLCANVCVNACIHVCVCVCRPWLCYWITHALNLLGNPIPPSSASRVISFLSHCQHPSGGFAGGPGQIPHLATTYAAVNCLVGLQLDEAIDVIDKPKLLDFLKRMHQPDGGYVMHEGGEVDVRGSYCALNSAHLLGLLTDDLKVSRAHTPHYHQHTYTHISGPDRRE